MAPGFGEDDQLLCAKYGIEPLCPVDSQGKFTSEVSDYAGLQVFDANKPIIAELKKRGVSEAQQKQALEKWEKEIRKFYTRIEKLPNTDSNKLESYSIIGMSYMFLFAPFIFSGKRVMAFALKGVIGCFSEIVFISLLIAKPTFIPSPEKGKTESAV